jgi:V/A-type H+-transporting ATPase subunit I
MIVPMKKVSLVVMDKHRELALKQLRELGIMHLQSRNAVSDKLPGLLERKNRFDNALGILRGYKAPEPAAEAPAYGRRKTDQTGDDAYNADAAESAVPQNPADQVLDLVDQRKSLQEQLAQEKKEAARIGKWGDFNPADLEALKSQGVSLTLYELTRNVYGALGDLALVLTLSRDKTLVYCVALGEALPNETPVILPEKSLGDLNRAMAEKQQILAAIEKQLSVLVAQTAAIQRLRAETIEEIEFETAQADMEVVENAEGDPVTVSCLTGYVPRDAVGTVKRGAAENGWALLIEDPAEEDRPPTLLSNNRFARLIEPLFKFLGTMPGYHEYDISFSYLLTFCLFFAMIFGDAAYGCLLFVISLVLAGNFKKKAGKAPDAVWLLTLLSSCTIVWGTINGSWFATPLDKLPGFLRALVIPPFDPAVSDTQSNVQFLCFSVGIIQLVYAHVKNIKRALPSLTAVAQFGWLSMMIGLYFLVLTMLLERELPFFAVPLIGGGLGLYFIFNKQEGGNFFVNILKSFADFLSTFLSAVSAFADIISYIRLFAVGLAGAAIAESFNNMGLGMPNLALRLTAGVLILIFGHGLNMIMNVLSVVVHGVRLNLLEYAGHLGLEWSGYSYAPFALKKKDADQK